MVCLADNQTGGKGQHGRTWYASPGKNLTFTIVLKPGTNKRLQLFSLSIMLALKETLSATLSCESVVKWPNDLLVSRKKVAGLLTESRYNGKILDRIMLGVGINVNQKSFPADLENRAASLCQHTGGQPLDRPLLLAVFLNRLEKMLESAQDGDLELIRNINRGIDGYGQWVSLQVNGNEQDTPVKILGVNESGYLMVLTATDDVKTFTHEQVRIKTRSD